MRAAEHAPRGPFRILERRHGLTEIFERGTPSNSRPGTFRLRATKSSPALPGTTRARSRPSRGTHTTYEAFSFVFQWKACVQMGTSRSCWLLDATRRPPCIFCRRGIAPRCRRGVSSYTSACGRGAPVVMLACFDHNILSYSVTHRGASWASGAAQAAQFVRIIF